MRAEGGFTFKFKFKFKFTFKFKFKFKYTLARWGEARRVLDHLIWFKRRGRRR
jgi:hypothetical protein